MLPDPSVYCASQTSLKSLIQKEPDYAQIDQLEKDLEECIAFLQNDSQPISDLQELKKR